MAEITAALVKELREKTDAPMMECKKALTEAAGDLARAEEILRVKLGSKASKAAGRVTAEGLIGLFISPDSKQGAVVEVNCETDFGAKTDDFVAFVNGLAQKEYLSLASVGIPSFNLLSESKKYPGGAANFIKLPTVINLALVLE